MSLQAVSRRRLLGLAAAPALLAACGRQENLDDVPMTGLSEGKVVYATWGSPQRREVENWSLLAFEKNYADLKVDVIWSPSVAEHVAKQHSLLSGGTPPDVLRLPAWSAPTFYYEEAVRPLDPYIRRDRFRTDNLAQPFDVATFKRRWFALPRGQSGTWAVFYNREVFGQAGLKAPAPTWTWDDFLKTAQQVTGPAAGGARWGIALESIADFYYPWLWGAGGDDFERPAEKSAIDQPPAAEALQWLADLRLKHRVAPPPGEVSDPFAAFAAGRLGMWFGPGDAELELAKQPSLDFAIAPQPRGKAGQYAGYKPEVMALSAGGQHPDDGWELMQFLVDLDAQQLEYDNGLWLPQARTIVGTEAYQKPAGPPHDRRATIPGVLARPRTPVILPRGDDMRAATLKELAPFWQGSRSVKGATEAAARAVNAIANGEA